jgi:phosphoribosylaminoimidazolecarboxamide formyltransferase/IMP cyclohydrolase
MCSRVNLPYHNKISNILLQAAERYLAVIEFLFMGKQAIISVSDKTNLEALLKALQRYDYQFISTGGTAKFIRELGFQVREISDLTGFPEMLDGRVKTLHPKALAGVLARRDIPEHLEDIGANQLTLTDLVVVNLYPFEESLRKPDNDEEDIIEKIDIGGPTLLRSAAKNYKFVDVLCDPNQYEDFISVIESQQGKTDENFRKKLALEVFAHTANYDALVARYFAAKFSVPNAVAVSELVAAGVSEDLAQEATKSRAEECATQKDSLGLMKNITIPLRFKNKLRYGENPHQEAVLCSDPWDKTGIGNARQVHGKEISFNNLLDLDAAWRIVSEYELTVPCISIIKHNNPCGVAIAPSVAQAFSDALSCDTVSAFGGIVASNNPVNLAAANEMSQLFLEAIVAPYFTEEALEILRNKKNLRLLECSPKPASGKIYDIKKISGAYLIQEADDFLLDPSRIEVVTQKSIEEYQWIDLLFAWKVVKHAKSNAIVTALNGKTLGIGVGQTNRVKAVEDAVRHFDISSRGAVLASDGFFPFADNIDIAAQNHISAIIQPGGSLRDKEVIEACDKYGIAMAFTHCRHFKH